MKRLHIKGKLVLCFSLLIAFIILTQFTVSFIGLEKAYNSTIKTADEKFDTTIKTAVENLISVLNANHQRYLSGEITEQEAVETAKKIVRGARYNNGNGYFWADTENGKCAIHINPEYEGKERYDNKDLNGTYYIRNLISAGNIKDGGYTIFYFTKPNEKGAFKKRAFTQKFEPYGWYISTGNYYDDMDKLINQYKADETKNLLILLASSIFALLIGIFFVCLLANKITNPLKQITKRLVLLAQGDLHTPVPNIHTKDETGILADTAKTTVSEFSGVIRDIGNNLHELSNGNFTTDITHNYKGDMIPIKESILQIRNSLNNTLIEIDRSADLVSNNSDQVSLAAQSLAQGATEQASSIETLSSTINDISTKVKDSANNAINANEKAFHVNKVIEVGDKQFKELVNAMENIASSSKQIKNIIKTIDDIAFQTNILALNAAVEASHAGEAGKGFAVVADEVGSLANKSAKAAKNTTLLIENALKAIEDGTNIVNSTTDTLEKVVSNTKDITFEIENISNSSNEQSQAIGDATQGLEQISIVVQQNSETAQESAEASKELSGQAKALKNLVGKFKLRNIL